MKFVQVAHTLIHYMYVYIEYTNLKGISGSRVNVGTFSLQGVHFRVSWSR